MIFFSLIGEEKGRPRSDSYLVDSASSHMLVSKILELIHAFKPRLLEGVYLLDKNQLCW